jgi:hypothetical protein
MFGLLQFSLTPRSRFFLLGHILVWEIICVAYKYRQKGIPCSYRFRVGCAVDNTRPVRALIVQKLLTIAPEFFSLLLLPIWSISQFHDHFTDGRTPWVSDQLVARPLSKHRTTETQNKRIRTPNIHVLCGVRTHNPGFRASEDSAYLGALGYRDRHITKLHSDFRKIQNEWHLLT